MIIKGELKIKQIYECSICNAKEYGDNVWIPVDVNNTLDLKLYIDQLDKSARNMPVGWASSFDIPYRCSKCVKKHLRREFYG